MAKTFRVKKAIRSYLICFFTFSIIPIISACGYTQTTSPISQVTEQTQTPSTILSTAFNPTSATLSASPTLTPFDTSAAKNAEVFVAAINAAHVYPTWFGVSLEMWVSRTGRNASYDAINKIINVNNPDGRISSVDLTSWFNSGFNSTPLAGAFWDTKALLMVNDITGNPVDVVLASNSASALSKGAIIVSWNAMSHFSQSISVIVNSQPMHDELTSKQNELDTAYANAQQVALNAAKAGQPYVQPNKNDYTITPQESAEIAQKYFGLKIVLFVPSN